MAVYYVTISMLTGAGYVLAQKKQGSKTRSEERRVGKEC